MARAVATGSVVVAMALAAKAMLASVRASLGRQGLGEEAAEAAAAMVAATKLAMAVVRVVGMGAGARVDEAARAAQVVARVAATRAAHW